jgi:hypothetical protein
MTGFRLARPSSVVSGRLHSSLVDHVVDEALFLGFLVDHLHLGGHRDDLVLEQAGGLGGGDALLAAQGVFVLVFAAEIVALGHDVGGVDHRHPQGRMGLHQLFFGDVEAVHVTAALHQRDRLDAAADGDIGRRRCGHSWPPWRWPAGPRSRSG